MKSSCFSFFLVLFAASLLQPLRADIITFRVIDAQTRQPIEGALYECELRWDYGGIARQSGYVDGSHYVLLDFWASWCGPCIASFPHMRQLHGQYKDRGLRILGISLDKDRQAWLAALGRHRNPWPQLHSPSSTGTAGQDAADLYGIVSIPALVLIAPDGTLLALDKDLYTPQQLDAKLAEVMGEAAAK